MQFFLYEIVARIVAVYFFVECSRTLWDALVERKIGYFNPGFLGWLTDWSNWDVDIQRDVAAVRYWMRIGGEILLLAGCLIVAIFGWWEPNT
jgi:fluoride ion exporter CrcB/FEX